jgi:hypothetical protein
MEFVIPADVKPTLCAKDRRKGWDHPRSGWDTELYSLRLEDRGFMQQFAFGEAGGTEGTNVAHYIGPARRD